jgi:hydrogenase/urease accessory protein HupE
MWALVAFGLALLLATGERNAAVIGALALLALLIGYVVGEDAQDYPAGSSLVSFWGLAALVAGPLVGIAA